MEAARRWAEVWQRAWRAHDVDAIAALYAANAYFQSHPFRAPEAPRGYVERVFAEEESADPRFEEPIADGERAMVEWRARTQLRDGTSENLVGVSLLRFDAKGLVTEQRDIWAAE
jgi:ketosteroid isomerase-like protein